MLTVDVIREILNAATFASFVGEAENACFEAKRELYDLRTMSGRVRLTKAVSSLANEQGGFVVFGLSTARDPQENIDVVNAVSLLLGNQFDRAACEGVCNSNIYPKIVGLEVGWVVDRDDANRGIGFVSVPPQDAQKKPFLMVEVADDGDPVRRIVFGVATRNKDVTDSESISALHGALKRGNSDLALRVEQVEQKLDVMLGLLQSGPRAEVAEVPATQLTARVDDIASQE